MKPEHLKSIRQKEVRRILKRQYEIYAELRNLGYRKLEKPIRHGWFKEIEITQSIERYKNKEAIEELFKVVENMFWGRTKELANKKWDAHVSEHLIYKNFPTISKRVFKKLSESAKAMCTSFYYQDGRRKLKFRFYIRIPKGVYKIKYTKAYITHAKKIDPVLLSEVALLNNRLLKNGYYEAKKKIENYKYYDDTEFRRQRRKIKCQLHMYTKHTIDQLLKEDLSWEKN
ncbi:hypothetical protein ACQY1Q_08315 [Tenacibaculum sp. TC6]|uniref:hypothetical protein n=1 Tax=Tenacibaculum sp. TC6 TaxID=3423223 RepID=UPI003D36D707